MAPINFTVSYRLGEYLQIVRELAHPAYDEEIRKRGKTPTKLDGFLFSILHTTIMAPIFAWKKFNIGTCQFKIDDQGVQRTSKGGSYVVAWDKVKTVKCLHEAYMIELDSGGMPLPYRCLNQRQRSDLESHLATISKMS